MYPGMLVLPYRWRLGTLASGGSLSNMPTDPTVSGSFPFPHPQQQPPGGGHEQLMPPWLWLLVALTGAGGAGSVGSLLGSQASQADLENLQENVEKVESKVDKLDSKINDLTIQIVRHHANDD